ncbi:MAG: hypothetical protein R2682_02315 [Pyrinomonadaceae bacterium]
MKRVYCVLLIVSVAITSLGCFSDERGALDAIAEKNKLADEATIRGDSAEAERSLMEAEQIAQGAGLYNLAISAKLSLAAIGPDPYKAEKRYLDAKRMCIEHNCAQLDEVNDWLFFTYVYRQKDQPKARAIVDEVISNKDHLAGQRSLEQRLRKFAAQYRGAGFLDAATDLERTIPIVCPPN